MIRKNQKIHTYFARDLVAIALRCSLVSILDVEWLSLKINANRLKQWNKQLNLNYLIRKNQKIHTYFALDLATPALRCSLISILGVDWPSLKINANRLKQWYKQLNLNYVIGKNQKIHTYFARDLVALALRCSLVWILDVDWPSLKMKAKRLKQLILNYMIRKNQKIHTYFARDLVALALRCSQVSILGVHWPSLKMNANR